MHGKSVEKYGYNGNADVVGCKTRMLGYWDLGWDCNAQLRHGAMQNCSSGLPETTGYVYDLDGNRVRKVTDRSVDDSDTEEMCVGRKLKETLYLSSVDIHRKYAWDENKIKFEKRTSNIFQTDSSL